MRQRDGRRPETTPSYAPSTGWILVGFCVLGLVTILSQRSPVPPVGAERSSALSSGGALGSGGRTDAFPSFMTSPSPSPSPSESLHGDVWPEGTEQLGWREVAAPEPDASIVRLDPRAVEDERRRPELEVQLKTVPLTTSEQLSHAFDILHGERGGALPGDSTRRAALEALLGAPSPEAAAILMKSYETAGGRRDPAEESWIRGRILGALQPEKDLEAGKVARFLRGVLELEGQASARDAQARDRAEQAAFALAARARLEGLSLNALLRIGARNEAGRRILASAWRRIGS